jgi:hypothetical protein
MIEDSEGSGERREDGRWQRQQRKQKDESGKMNEKGKKAGGERMKALLSDCGLPSG